MRFEEWMESYLDELRSTAHSPQYCLNVAKVLMDFRDWCRYEAQLATPAEVTPQHLQSWMMLLQWTPTARGRLRADVTVYEKLRVVTACFARSYERQQLLTDPGLHLVLPTPLRRGPERILSCHEVTQLLEAPDPFSPRGRRDRAVLAVFYDAALRLAECEALDVGDVDLAERHLTVRQAKNGEARRVPLGDGLAARLQLYLARARPRLLNGRPDDGALFLSKDGVRLSHQSMENVVVAACRKVGLPRAGPHALRHACATHMLANGAPLQVIQRLLGHRNPGSTVAYTHLVPQDVLAEFRRTHPRALAPPPGTPPTSL